MDIVLLYSDGMYYNLNVIDGDGVEVYYEDGNLIPLYKVHDIHYLRIHFLIFLNY